MQLDWHIKVILLIATFFFSALFSGSEVSLFSLNRKKLKDSLDKHPLIERYLRQLLDHPRRLLITILIGNTVVNVIASIIAVSIALDVAAVSALSINLLLTFQIIVLTILLVIFGELIPKVWAANKPIAFAKYAALPLYWLSVLIFPVAETLTEIIRMSVSKLKFDKSKTVILPEELPELADLSRERGALIEGEHGLLSNIVSFRSVHVNEVMTPRVDMVCVQVNCRFDDLLDVLTSTGHSRIPLYENDLDNIRGIIYAKDILPYIKNVKMRETLSLPGIARKVLFVPKMKMIDDLMHEFQEKKLHLAIVVDEYGGTAGLITLEDILEEILGEIRDEYDKEESPVSKINDNSFLVLGKMPVSDLYELLQLKELLPEGEFETVAGLILNYSGHIPKEGYSFQLENYKFTVKEVINKRIKKVLVDKLS